MIQDGALWDNEGNAKDGGIPHPCRQRELFVIALARELYDRFVMGGWEPQDAYQQIRDMLALYESTSAPPATSPEPALTVWEQMDELRKENADLRRQLQEVKDSLGRQYEFNLEQIAKLAEAERRLQEAHERIRESSSK